MVEFLKTSGIGGWNAPRRRRVTRAALFAALATATATLGVGASCLAAQERTVADAEVASFLGVAGRKTASELPTAAHPALTVTRDDASGTYRTSIPNTREGVTLVLPVERGEKVSVNKRRSANNRRLKFDRVHTRRDGQRYAVLGFHGLAVGGNAIDLEIARRGQREADRRVLSFVVTRAETRGGDPSLSSIAVPDAQLDPAFSPEILAYEASVPYAADGFPLSVERAEPGTGVTLSGTDPAGVALDVDTGLRVGGLGVGRNAIRVLATSEDGSNARTYALDVVRNEASADTTLLDLALAPGARSSFFFFGLDIPSRSVLEPAFSGETRRYRATVPSDGAELSQVAMRAAILPIQSARAAGLAADGTRLPATNLSGSATGSVAGSIGDHDFLIGYFNGLRRGVSTIEIRVTAEDGVSESVYVIDVRVE